MLRSLLTSIFLFASILCFATTRTSTGDGNWSSASTWSPSGVPASGDDVIIEDGHTVTLDASYTCASLTLNNKAAVAGATDSELLINNGYTLTVTGNVIQNTDISGLSTGSTNIQIFGTLDIGGNHTLNNTLLTLAGTNSVVIGSTTESGTLNITGNLALDNNLVTALGVSNQFTIGYGTLNVDGNISASAGLINLLGTNIITAYDDGGYDGLAKYFKYGGNNIDMDNEGSITVTDANSNTIYEFWYDGTAAQTVEDDNIVYNHLYIKNTAADVDLEASLTNAIVEGKLYIDDGAKLHLDAAAKNLDNLSGSTDKINILAGGTLKLSPNAYPDGIPPNTVITSNVNGIVEFYHPTGGSSADVFQESIDYPIVKLSGAGTKALGSASLDIDDSAPRVSKIWLAEGVFQVDDAKEISLNSSYGVKTMQLDSNTTMRIDGDFTTLDTYWDVHRDNTINYYGNAAQKMYELTSDGSTFTPYGILRLERTSGSSVDRTLPASDTIHVANRIEIEDEIELILYASSYVKLLSNVQYTAYIAEIASSATLIYSGTPKGMIGVQKYLPLPYRAFRDVASPIKSTTLASWNDAGLNMRGFTGSNSPGAGRVTVHYYDEPTLNELNIGFQEATNTTNAVHVYDGSRLETSAWRVLDGNNSDTTYAITLEDKGQIFKGNQTYKLTFNYSAYDGSSRTDHDGWNFLGNPYAAPLNWNDIYNDASNSSLKDNNYITSTMYVLGQIDRYWNDSENPGYYGFYNAATSTSFVHDSIIPAYQGFWVKAYHASSSSEDYTLTIKEEHKYSEENSNYYKSHDKPAKKSAIDDVAMRMTFKNGNSKEIVWIQPFADATPGKDFNLDVAKFGSSSGKSFNLDFLEGEDWLNLWVNAVSLDQKELEMPIAIKSNRSGEHFIQFDNIATVNDQHCVVLYNKATGKTEFITEGKQVPVFLTDGLNMDYVIKFTQGYAARFQTEDPACKGDMGFISITANEMFQSENWEILYNGANLSNKAVGANGLHFQGQAGTYKFTNLDGYVACGQPSKEIVLKVGEYVNPDFTWDAGDTLVPNTTVSFLAEQSEVDSSIWYVNEEKFQGTVLDYSFMQPGNYVVVHSNSKKACTKQQEANLVVSEPLGIEDTYISKEFWIENSTLYFRTAPKDLRIFDVSGKELIYISNQPENYPLKNGLYLYCFDEICVKVSFSAKP